VATGPGHGGPLVDRYLVEAGPKFGTRDTCVGYSKKHLRPLIGKTKAAHDAGMMDSLYAEFRRCRGHCKKARGQLT
jgi:hypothetical protein